MPEVASNPPKLEETIIKWVWGAYGRWVLALATRELSEAKAEMRTAKSKADKIMGSQKAFDDAFQDELGRDWEITKDEFIDKIKNKVSRSGRRYNNLFDLVRFLKEAGIRRDFDMEERLAQTTELHRKFDINIDGWEHEQEIRQKAGERQLEPIGVLITTDPRHRALHGGAIGAIYNPIGHYIAVSFGNIEPKSVADIQTEWNSIQADITHELNHAVTKRILWPLDIFEPEQSGSYVPPGYGHPGEDDDYDQSDKSKLGKYYYATRTEYSSQWRTAVAEFMSMITHYPDSDVTHMARVFTGEEDDEWGRTHEWFAALKEWKPEVWRAVKEQFYKIVAGTHVKKYNAGSSSYHGLHDLKRLRSKWEAR